MKKMNLRKFVLLALSLAMLALATSCEMPWAKEDPAETSDTASNDTSKAPEQTEAPATTTKPKEEVVVPDVEHKNEMSDDDFIHGTWGDTSEK